MLKEINVNLKYKYKIQETRFMFMDNKLYKKSLILMP